MYQHYLSDQQRLILSRYIVSGAPVDELLVACGGFPSLELIKTNHQGFLPFLRPYNEKDATKTITLVDFTSGKSFQTGYEPIEIRILYGNLEIYHLLIKDGCPMQRISLDWTLWGEFIVVTEPLYPVSSYQNPAIVATSLVKQLKYIHKYTPFGVITWDSISQCINGNYYFLDLMKAGKNGATTCYDDFRNLAALVSPTLLERIPTGNEVPPDAFYDQFIADLAAIVPVEKPKTKVKGKCCILM